MSTLLLIHFLKPGLGEVCTFTVVELMFWICIPPAEKRVWVPIGLCVLLSPLLVSLRVMGGRTTGVVGVTLCFPVAPLLLSVVLVISI